MSIVEPVTAPIAPEIVVVPIPVVLARPCEPDALLMVATLVADEAQVDMAVTSRAELSVNVPVAVNCCGRPFATLGFAGVTWMLTTTAGVTANGALPEIVPDVAVMVVAPTPAANAAPCEPVALLIVEVAVLEELHRAVVVRFCVVLSV